MLHFTLSQEGFLELLITRASTGAAAEEGFTTCLLQNYVMKVFPLLNIDIYSENDEVMMARV